MHLEAASLSIPLLRMELLPWHFWPDQASACGLLMILERLGQNWIRTYMYMSMHVFSVYWLPKIGSIPCSFVFFLRLF